MPSLGFEPAIRAFKRLQMARPPDSARYVLPEYILCVCVCVCVCVGVDVTFRFSRRSPNMCTELSAASSHCAVIFGTLNRGRNPNTKRFSIVSILKAVSIKSKQIVIDLMSIVMEWLVVQLVDALRHKSGGCGFHSL
jgi:hypothetical protein